ncbi:uncharacterized protein LOC125490621 [Plutella xylostella]|uniref:uncharacterized protein LOC125490621 n=1 Tax=Plutella xylostella TaxID=51655 RepID=UPI002032F993|nr:uncharacterized protein LOC125490621 [Plutella xylostella]
MNLSVYKMGLNRKLLFSCCIVSLVVNSNGLFYPSSIQTGIDGVHKATRWNIPWLGLGVYCNGCPARSCEDDEAIIHGYCCGCAHHADRLPVTCPEFLQCPLNTHGLCHDYEYMMRCCC